MAHGFTYPDSTETKGVVERLFSFGIPPCALAVWTIVKDWTSLLTLPFLNLRSLIQAVEGGIYCCALWANIVTSWGRKIEALERPSLSSAWIKRNASILGSPDYILGCDFDENEK